MTTQTNEQTNRRPSSRHEARDVAQAARRMIRALVRRAGEGDTEALRELVDTQRMIATAITEAGAAAYATGHYSFTDLAGELGITRQAARQRFAPLVANPLYCGNYPDADHRGCPSSVECTQQPTIEGC